MSCFLEPAWAKEIYADPKVVTGGAFAPSGKGVRVEGGYRVTGRWMWGSGTQHCHWIAGGTIDRRRQLPPDVRAAGRGGDPRHLVHVGPAGHRVERLPDDRRLRARRPLRAALRRPAARWTLPSPASRTSPCWPPGSPPRCSASPATPSTSWWRWPRARCRCSPRGRWPSHPTPRSTWPGPRPRSGAARAFLLDELAAAWDVACAGDHVPVERRARIRLAATHAAKASAGCGRPRLQRRRRLVGLHQQPAAALLPRRAHRHAAPPGVRAALRDVGRLLFGLESDTSAL